MKLGRLAKLEKIELEQEKTDLTNKIINCMTILENDSKKKDIFLERLRAFGKKYGTVRKTELTHIETPKTKEEKEVANVPPEKCAVVMTKGGSIKRIPATSFRTQRRGGKGVKTQDDITSAVIRTNTVDNLMIFSTTGKMYRLLVDNIPVGTNVSKGVPIKTLVEMEPNEYPATIYSIYKDTDAQFVFFATKGGLIKKTSLDEYLKTKKKNGIGAITFRDNDQLATVTLIKDENIILVTKQGNLLYFNSADVGASSRMTQGVKGITLKENDEVIAALPVRDLNDQIALFSESGFGKKVSLKDLVIQHRGGKGVSCYKGEDGIASAAMVSDTDNVLIIGNNSSICISAKDIPSVSRTATGNTMLKNNKILSVSKV